MQIVIDVPKSIPENTINLEGVFTKAAINGIVLPKGHGRLIDAEKLIEYCQNQKSNTISCNDIARFPTIIPADTEESE
jgi:hypothetical protein